VLRHAAEEVVMRLDPAGNRPSRLLHYRRRTYGAQEQNISQQFWRDRDGNFLEQRRNVPDQSDRQAPLGVGLLLGQRGLNAKRAPPWTEYLQQWRHSCRDRPRRAIFDLKANKIHVLRGINIYKLSGELVGRLATGGADKHLDKAMDRLVPTS